MTDHKANPKQWVRLEERRLAGNDLVCAVLELRARVEALEDAQTDRRFEAAKVLIDHLNPTTDHLLGEEKPD